MQTKYSILLLLFLLSAFPFASASAQRGDDKKGTAAVTPRLEELQEKGSEALFNLDYEVARQRFKEMARLYPEDTNGPNKLPARVWIDTSNQARWCQTVTYTTQFVYATTEDTSNPPWVGCL